MTPHLVTRLVAVALLVAAGRAADHGVAPSDSLYHGSAGSTHIEPGIGVCVDPVRGAECFVSCERWVPDAADPARGVVSRDPYLVVGMAYESSYRSGLRVTARLKTADGLDVTAVSPRPRDEEIDLATCRRSGTALGMRADFLTAMQLVMSSAGLAAGSGDPIDNVVGPCAADSRGVARPQPHCFVSCVTGRDGRGPVMGLFQIMDSSDFSSRFVVRDLTTGQEDTVDRRYIDGCMRSPEAWRMVSTPPASAGETAAAVVPKTGNLWDSRFSDRPDRRAVVADKGVPVGGTKTVLLKDIKRAIAQGAPAAGTETQRVSESPYILPKYRIEILPVSGDVYVNMPVSRRFHEATGKTDVTAEEYLLGLFEGADGSPGILPRTMEDVAGPARAQFQTECDWSEGGYLWAMSSVHGGNMNEFRIVIAPECVYYNSPHKFSRIVKHGDLVPMRLPDDPVRSAMDGAQPGPARKFGAPPGPANKADRRWVMRTPKEDTPAENQKLIDRCVRASRALIAKGAGAGILPTWGALTDPDPRHLFSGSCRGVAYVAGELYSAQSLRAVSRFQQGRVGVFGKGISEEAEAEGSYWLMDADSSYTYLRTDSQYTGAEVMGLVKSVLGSMLIPVSPLHINVKGTDVTLDPSARELVLPASIVGSERRQPHSVLARNDEIEAFPGLKQAPRIQPKAKPAVAARGPANRPAAGLANMRGRAADGRRKVDGLGRPVRPNE